MSHFTVTVALPGTLTEEQIPEALAAALAPFDENKQVPRYVKYTRDQLIEKGRKKIEGYQQSRYYQEFTADPYAYAAQMTQNALHLEYLAGGTARVLGDPKMAAEYWRLHLIDTGEETALPAVLQRKVDVERMPYAESFPAKLDWDDDQVYAHEIQYYEPEDITPEGGVYSEYNPLSQWDYYSVGGRWAGYWRVHDAADNTEELSAPAWEGRARLGTADQKYVDERTSRPGRWVDVARKYDIDFTGSDSEDRGTVATFAFLSSEGKWHEKAKMGWWATTTNEKAPEDWNAEYSALVEAESDNAWFVLVDCHI